MSFVWIGFFGMLGVFSRYLVGLGAIKVLPPTFPFGTLTANLVGAFLIGLLYVICVEKSLVTENLRLGIIVGFLGGFTTFSSYTLESVRLLEEARYISALFYFIASPLLGAMGTFFGLILGRLLFGVGRFL